MNNILKNMRLNMLEMAYASGKTGAHIGPALSLSEIMAVLYFNVMNFDPKNPLSDNRDRLILSKGHGVIAQYAALKELGMITKDELLTYKHNETKLYAHPSMNSSLGIEFSSGSLGMGLSQGVGVALALKYKKINSKVYVILGDGECNEGTIWEALMSAGHYKLDNLIVIIDKNDLQYDDFTKNVMSLEPLDKKTESFGAKATVVDGHDVNKLKQVLSVEHREKPLCIVAQTIKGKGVSFMENEAKWHNGVLTEELYNKALLELGGV